MLTVFLVNILHTYIPAVTTCIFSEFVLGTTVQDMQVGCLWQGDHIITVSLSGFINYLDVNNPTTPLRVVKVKALASWHHGNTS